MQTGTRKRAYEHCHGDTHGKTINDVGRHTDIHARNIQTHRPANISRTTETDPQEDKPRLFAFSHNAGNPEKEPIRRDTKPRPTEIKNKRNEW